MNSHFGHSQVIRKKELLQCEFTRSFSSSLTLIFNWCLAVPRFPPSYFQVTSSERQATDNSSSQIVSICSFKTLHRPKESLRRKYYKLHAKRIRLI